MTRLLCIQFLSLLPVCSCGAQAVTNGATAPTGATVKVTYNGTSSAADLSLLAPVTLGGADYARLSHVVLTVLTGKSLDQVKVTNFLGSDGFSPLAKSNCVALFPLDGATLVKGYIDPATRNLKWDDALGYPGCLSVKDTAEILIADK